MGSNFNSIKAAAVAVFAVVYAVIYAASNVSVSINHDKIPPISFAIIFCPFFKIMHVDKKTVFQKNFVLYILFGT